MMKKLPDCLDCRKPLKRQHNKRCRECFCKFISSRLSGEKHYRYKDGRKKPCNTCGKIITAPYPRNCRECWRKAQIGKIPENCKNTGKTQFKKGLNPWNKGMVGLNSGSSNPAWKGGIKKIYTRMRRKLVRQLGGYTPEKIDSVIRANEYEFGKNKCIYCLKDLSFKEIIIEHKTPLSRGGDNSFENLAVSCRSCNSTKHSKTFEEFMACRK